MTLAPEPLPSIPDREPMSHKGSYGKVLAFAGSRGMSGAAALCGLAALRGGAGLVTVASAEETSKLVATFEPSLMTLPLPEDAHSELAPEAELVLNEAAAARDAFAMGPGLGTSDVTGSIVNHLFESLGVPSVIDADALNILAERTQWPSEFPAVRILTPHPGEFSRLIGQPITDVQANRQELAQEFAAKRNVILLLKGTETVITDGERIAINRTGNPGMATGGAGDVLTGLILALLGDSRIESYEAVRLAAHLHGLAGDIAASEMTQPGMIASDIIQFLPRAWDEYFRSGPM